MALKWRFDYGSKYLSFESIANIASEAMSVSVATTSSEFKSFKASFDASKTASGIEVLTKIREDVMDVLEAHLLLENRSSHYLNSTFLSKKLRHFLELEYALEKEEKDPGSKKSTVVKKLTVNNRVSDQTFL